MSAFDFPAAACGWVRCWTARLALVRAQPVERQAVSRGLLSNVRRSGAVRQVVDRTAKSNSEFPRREPGNGILQHGEEQCCVRFHFPDAVAKKVQDFGGAPAGAIARIRGQLFMKKTPEAPALSDSKMPRRSESVLRRCFAVSVRARSDRCSNGRHRLYEGAENWCQVSFSRAETERAEGMAE